MSPRNARSRRSVVLLLILGLVVLGLVPSASAAKPANYSYTFNSVWSIGSCDSFDIIEDVIIDMNVRFYFDKDGIETRSRWQHDMNGRVYNSTNPDKWLSEVGHFISTDYPDTGTGAQVGLNGHVIVPGEGHVVLDAGRFIYDFTTYEILWQAGPHEVFNQELDQLCEALS